MEFRLVMAILGFLGLLAIAWMRYDDMHPNILD